MLDAERRERERTGPTIEQAAEDYQQRYYGAAQFQVGEPDAAQRATLQRDLGVRAGYTGVHSNGNNGLFMTSGTSASTDTGLSSALGNLGVDPWGLEDVILTHMHFDHVGGLMEFPGRRVYVHEIELDAPYAFMQRSLLETVDLEVLSGDAGEIEPGLRWMLTPGHCDGLITLLVDTDDGLVAIPSDCVGPLPEYFEQMELPEDFPGREILLEQWQKIRDQNPVRIIPGHYPPFDLTE